MIRYTLIEKDRRTEHDNHGEFLQAVLGLGKKVYRDPATKVGILRLDDEGNEKHPPVQITALEFLMANGEPYMTPEDIAEAERERRAVQHPYAYSIPQIGHPIESLNHRYILSILQKGHDTIVGVKGETGIHDSLDGLAFMLANGIDPFD